MSVGVLCLPYHFINFPGESFDLMDGILGMALSPHKPGRERNLYFHALAATTENIVNTRVIRNDSYAESGMLDSNSVFVSMP